MARKSDKPVTVPQESSFEKDGKTFPVMLLPNANPEKSHYPTQIGVSKIQAVLENLDACKAFVEKHRKPKASDQKINEAVLKSLIAKGVCKTSQDAIEWVLSAMAEA